jgi:hypothetical protein
MRGIRSIASRGLLLAATIGLGAMAMPAPAHAWWRGGYGGGLVIGIAPPYYAPPPVYYAPPPPVYYAPPPGYPPAYAPPGYAPAAADGGGCYAGQYVCPLAHATPVGANCSCPTDSGRIYGSVR